MTEVQLDLDRALSRRFAAPAEDARATRTTAALEANGITVLRAPNSAEAKRIVLDLIPAGSHVHQGASQSLEASGIAGEIERSGRYEPLRPRVFSMDRATQADEIRRPTASPDAMLGSVHAVTETGSLVAASASGSQLSPYASSAGKVILVVGRQKIVVGLEDARAQAAYGVHSGVDKFSSSIASGRPTASRSSSAMRRWGSRSFHFLIDKMLSMRLLGASLCRRAGTGYACRCAGPRSRGRRRSRSWACGPCEGCGPRPGWAR